MTGAGAARGADGNPVSKNATGARLALVTEALNTAKACGAPFDAVVAGATLSAAAAERLNAAQHSINPMTDFNGCPLAVTRALFGGSGDRAKPKLY